MDQTSLGNTGFEKNGKNTRRARFLSDMDCVAPSAELCGVI